MVVIVARSRNRNHRCHQQRRTCHQQTPRLPTTSPRKHVQLGEQIQRKVAQGGKCNCRVMSSKVSTVLPSTKLSTYRTSDRWGNSSAHPEYPGSPPYRPCPP
uniref:(northern house mosquito) hypothetical protein n=1 Tax=Culex pipiens TaxID=7175 RepID=A0A8D8ACC9_CULPI